MTGAYLRVQRGEKWGSIEIEHLTDKEREECLKNDQHLIKWIHMLYHEIIRNKDLESIIDDEVERNRNRVEGT